MQEVTWKDLIFIGIGILLAYPLAYLKKKGENLAIKEGIDGVARQLESIKTEMGARLYIHQIRYQNEFEILKALAEKVVELKDSALSLRPVMDRIDPNESEDQRKEKRLRAFSEAGQSFYKHFETKRPFYPEGIYQKLKELSSLVRKEAVQYGLFSDRGKGYDPQYWEKAMANADEISKMAEVVMELIRERIVFWEKFDQHNVFPANERGEQSGKTRTHP